jgi:truncated hemoglobin YjbI
MADSSVPTLYEWIGGIDALNRLTTRFYEHVKDDPMLAPIFAHMGPDHPAHVATFLAEVLGGPTEYSAQHGGHPHMIRQHLNRHLAQEQRRRWVALLPVRVGGVSRVGVAAGGDQFATRGRGRSQRSDAEVGLGRGQGPLPRLSPGSSFREVE